MRYQSLALLAMACSIVLAREDTAELCTGTLSCDEGYCCSSHGFCGRSTLHCSHSSGCNELKGTCGVVVLDKENLPRVISYMELDQGSMKNLAKQLVDQGSQVSPDELKAGITIESILEGGVAEKEKMVASSTTGDNANNRPNAVVSDADAASPVDVIHLPSSASASTEPKGALLVENVSGDITSADSKKTAEAPVDSTSDARKLTASVAGAALGIFTWFF
ncbi:hypothetical protein BGZ97_005607 [Linnemannia gamsii]|uniref:Chitin-binding type-1 domain-containing protein n=1 Tax=Linnemannia gamsii TaxID=64522 RepID=A0A9P6QQP9_9FUNG|nr:hypothetical protein BGZ97_005607 [Linnemannia gamsii]